MIAMYLVQFTLGHIHVSHGPYGLVAWVQPPHVSAGIELVRGHLGAWFGMQRPHNLEHVSRWQVW